MPQVGDILLGKYRIIRPLGVGGMGAVYEAEHIEIGKHVAVKVLHESLSQNPDLVTRFTREARAAGAIGHVSIIDVYDIGTSDDGSLCMVMELLDGQDLGAVLKQTSAFPDIGVAIYIVCQTLSALHAAHQKNIVHRDLKPDNIFLVRTGQVLPDIKLLDFGISKMLAGDAPGDRLTRTGTIMGTPFYMAPEQARGRKDLDHRVDIYAMGVILYECLTGKLPFWAENTFALVYEILHSPVTPPRQLRPDIPPELEGVVLKALARDREARYQSALEMLRDLLPFLPEIARARVSLPAETAIGVGTGDAGVPVLPGLSRGPSSSGVVTPGLGLGAASSGVSSPAMGIPTPSGGGSSPGLGVSTPGMGTVTAQGNAPLPETQISSPDLMLATPKGGVSTPGTPAAWPQGAQTGVQPAKSRRGLVVGVVIAVCVLVGGVVAAGVAFLSRDEGESPRAIAGAGSSATVGGGRAGTPTTGPSGTPTKIGSSATVGGGRAGTPTTAPGTPTTNSSAVATIDASAVGAGGSPADVGTPAVGLAGLGHAEGGTGDGGAGSEGAGEVTITLEGLPEGASVTLDGQPVDGNQLRGPRSEEEHEVVVGVAGRVAWRQRVVFDHDREISVELDSGGAAAGRRGGGSGRRGRASGRRSRGPRREGRPPSSHGLGRTPSFDTSFD